MNCNVLFMKLHDDIFVMCEINDRDGAICQKYGNISLMSLLLVLYQCFRYRFFSIYRYCIDDN